MMTAILNIELNHENEDFDLFDINNLPNNLWGSLRIKLEFYRIIERISFGIKIKSKNKAILALNIVISASCDTDLNSENNKGVKHNIISIVVFKIAEPV